MPAAALSLIGPKRKNWKKIKEEEEEEEEEEKKRRGKTEHKAIIKRSEIRIDDRAYIFVVLFFVNSGLFAIFVFHYALLFQLGFLLCCWFNFFKLYSSLLPEDSHQGQSRYPA